MDLELVDWMTTYSKASFTINLPESLFGPELKKISDHTY